MPQETKKTEEAKPEWKRSITFPLSCVSFHRSSHVSFVIALLQGKGLALIQSPTPPLQTF
jgi:hypothetical protein